LKLNPLYIFIGSFIFGVALFSIYGFEYLLLLLFLLPIFLFKDGKYAFIIAIVFVAILLGGARILLLDFKADSRVLDSYLLEEVVIEGIVVEEPSVRSRSQRITLEVSKVAGGILSTKTKLVTSVEKFPRFRYGDEVSLVGIIESPENFLNEQGREFNYIDYLKKDGVYYTMSFPEATVLSGGNGNSLKHGLFFVKQKWLSKIQELIPDPHAALLGGLVVGAKESLGEKLEDDFRKTGIIHIVVLSGYNVTIVAESLMRFFSFLPRMFSLSLGAVSIVFFAILTGASATIVRASIMALLVLLARATGRTNEITHALLIAAFFMVLHNPMIVIYDPSFQLSFLATLGLIYVSPYIEKYLKLVPTKWQLREFATATVATQIFVLPLLLYIMGEFSLVALPVNILVLAFVPLTMLFGFLTGVLGLLSATLAFPFTAISYGLLSYELLIVDLFARLPFASIFIPKFPLWTALLFYCVYGIFLYRLSKKVPS